MERPAIRILFQLLHKFGVRDILCSPGSRNASLISELDAYGAFNAHVVVDERSAAFVGLGIALNTRRPVALVCTSGSAVLNYAPAVSEAFYQGIPLIVISADRPYEWIDQDDSQTIRQYEVLSHIVKGSYDIISENTGKEYLWYVNRILNEALLKATKQKCGPIHINIHINGNPTEICNSIKDTRKVEVKFPVQNIDRKSINILSERIKDRKVMLVAGFMQPDDKLQKAVLSLAALPNIAVLAETISNLHLPQNYYKIDTVLFPADDILMQKLAPEIVISIGGALISRKLKEYIRKNPPVELWSVGYSDVLVDCFKSLTLQIECEPSLFIKSLASGIRRCQRNSTNIPSYKNMWNKERDMVKIDDRSIPWSDLKAMAIVMRNLSSQTNLMLSNGTAVRYGQIIPYDVTHATYSNRGVSGIEGCMSTAVGLSLYYHGITCLITGDMSFGYDMAALNSNLLSENLRIVVLDNNGGDIFRFIPATSSLPIRERYLSVGKELPICLLADAFGILYYHVDSAEKLESVIQEFLGVSPRPAILHINTRSANNSAVLRKFLCKK